MRQQILVTPNPYFFHVWGITPRQTLVGPKVTDGKVNLLYNFDNGLCRGAFASFQELGNIHNQACSTTCARILSTGKFDSHSVSFDIR